MVTAKLGAGLSALQGKLGNVCGKVIRGKQQISRLSLPYDISGMDPSSDQVAARIVYAAAVQTWRTASTEEREAWNLLGKPLRISGFNYLVAHPATPKPPWGLVWNFAQTLIPDGYIGSLRNLGGGLCLAGGGFTGTLFKSVDYGVSWTLIRNVDSTDVSKLGYLGNGICIAGVWNPAGIWRSIDYGDTWDLVAGAELAFYGVVGFDHDGAGCCLALGDYPTDVWKSIDWGETWDLAYNFGEDLSMMNLGCVEGGVWIVLADWGRIYRSVDNGDSWTLVYEPEKGNTLLAFLYVGDGICICAGVSPDCVYRSDDYGLTWTLVYASEIVGEFLSLAYLGNGIIIAGTDEPADIYRSQDYGLTWERVQTLGTELNTFAVESLGNGVCLAGTGYGGQIWRSTP